MSDTVLPDGVYAELRRSLLAGEEHPGSVVAETAVAERFDVARPTAKLAIERLVAEGLLHREAHRAARVPELERDDVVDLFDNRAIVEGAAIEALARSGAIPAAAVRAHRELIALPEDGAFAALDAEFHRALVAAQPSPRLARLHGLLMGEIELCIAQVQAGRLLTAAEVGAQHQGILDAILVGDSERADRLTREHIAGARDRLVAQYDRAAGRAERML